MKRILFLLASLLSISTIAQNSLPDTDPVTIATGISYKNGPGGAGGWTYNYGTKLTVWGSSHRNFEIMNTHKDQQSTLAFRTYDGGVAAWAQWREFLFRDSNGHLVFPVETFYSKAQTNFDGDLLLKSSNTSGIDQYGAAVSFSKINGGSNKRASIVAKQTGTDQDVIGLSFFTHTGMASDDLIERMIIEGNGNVGVGTTNPEFKLDVNGTLTSRGEMGIVHSNPGFLFNESDVTDKNWHMQVNGGDFKLFEVDDARATWSQKLVVKNGTGNVGIGTTNPSAQLDVAGVIAVGETSIEKRFKIWAGGTGTANHMRIGTDYGHYGDAVVELYQNHPGGGSQDPGKMIVNGELGVGNATIPSGYKLAVDGKIISEEVKVQVSSSWPDYVFSSDYELMPLEEIEKFIQSNQHLPEIPSAQEIEANGVQLGEMNRLLLQKIEELTLHVIDLKKENLKQQEEIEKLKQK